MAFVRDLDNIIPIMTSNTAPSGYVASASSELSAAYMAYMAFNGGMINGDDMWASNTTVTGWLKIQLPIAKIVNKIKLSSQDYAEALNRAPNSWTFEGSNNDTDWTTLDTRIGISAWAQAETRSFVFSNITSYIYYRINVTANNGGTLVAIGELELCSTSSGPLRLTQCIGGF